LPSGLYLIHTRLGYLFSGKFENSFESLGYTIINLDNYVFTAEDDIEFENKMLKDVVPKSMETFWDLGTIGIKDCPYVCDDDLALQNFYETVEYSKGRY